MATLSEQQKVFIARRERLSRSWPRVGTTLILLWFSFGIYFIFDAPELIRPGAVFERIWRGEGWESEVSFVVALAPILFIVIWALVLGLLFNNTSWVLHEKKLLTIIADLQVAKEIITSRYVVAAVWCCIAIYSYFVFASDLLSFW